MSAEPTLHTESVTYLSQRAESQAGMFFFATLYLAIRGFGSSRPWPKGAVASMSTRSRSRWTRRC